MIFAIDKANVLLIAIYDYFINHNSTVVMTDFENKPTHIDRRSGTDRRGKNPPLFNRYLLKGKRAVPRRMADRQKIQKVDRYSSRIFAVIIIILLLSMLDALFTLLLVDNGAREVNPLMAYYLDRGPILFFSIKYFLTCASVILILSCKDVYLFKTRTKARILFYLIPIPFVLVIQWQLRLIFSAF